MPLLTTVAAGAAAAVIGNFFQKRQFKFNSISERQIRLRNQREDFVNTLMKRVSTRLYNLIEVIKILKDITYTEDYIDPILKQYQQSIEDTLVNYSLDLVYLEKFFDQPTSNQYQQIMQGQDGFVELHKAWEKAFKKYTDLKNNALPAIQEILEKEETTEEATQKLIACKDKFLQLLQATTSELINKAMSLGNNPIGHPFYTTITSKEDLTIF